jgi:hypothetical protein
VLNDNRRITRLTALMAGHGLTFLQIYSFYSEVAQAHLHAHLRAQVVIFGAAMLLGVAAAYLALTIPDDRRPIIRRGLEIFSASILILEWIVLGRTYLNLH